MKLILSEKALEEIVQHLEKCYPEEACGLLLGERVGEIYKVFNVYLTQNVWEKKEERGRRYAVSPREFIKAEREAEKVGFSILGIFHSHPDYPAYPSQFDRDQAWEGYIYLILSLKGGKVVERNAFLFSSAKEPRSIPIEIVKEVRP